MLVERFAENPLITPADVVPSRADYEVVGAFNAAATVYNDEILLLLRVAERPKDKADDEELAPILDPETGQINPLRIKHGDGDLEILDSRVFNYKGKMYLTSISHLRLARSKDGSISISTRHRRSFLKRTMRPSAWRILESLRLETSSILRIRS